jgi:hypothetical protein
MPMPIREGELSWSSSTCLLSCISILYNFQTIEFCILVCVIGKYHREHVQLQHLALGSIASVNMLGSSN